MLFKITKAHNSASISERNIYLIWFLISKMIMTLTLSVSLPLSGTSSACKAISTCDPFMPICAASTNEHQFFYSHCEMLRDACLTGKDWKTDYFNHCNVSKL